MENIDERRITYKKNVLDRVICQLRFRPILKIETTIPAEFQEKIRKKFPIYRDKSEFKIQVDSKEIDIIPSEIVEKIGKSPMYKNHEFSTESGDWAINLTRHFIALSTKSYTSWDNFQHQLFKIVEYLIDIYDISEFTRLGLRYINIIQRTLFNLENVEWDKLLNKELLGLMSTQDYGEMVTSFESKFNINLEDGQSNLRVITQLVEEVDSREKCVKIDNDIYSVDKYSYEDINEKLLFFNEVGTNFFFWCISERLHKAMEPEFHE